MPSNSVRPTIMKYTLHILGDSFARRFDSFLNSNQDQQSQITVLQHVSIAGCRINQLKYYLKSNRITFETNSPLALFIGSNDISKGSNLPLFKSQYLALIRYLQRTNPEIRLIINELPNYLRFRSTPSIMKFVQEVNQFFASLRSPNTMVITSNHIFQHERYFHSFYGNTTRIDGIHLNDLGHKELLQIYINLLTIK